MRLAGNKTQVLALLQRYEDARDLHIHVDGARVNRSRHLNLLGVSLDRQLHMGEYCARLRRKVQPRTAQLRKLTGRTRRLQELQPRAVANGYIRGALEFAAAACLPAHTTHTRLTQPAAAACPLLTRLTPDSHEELLERGMPWLPALSHAA